MLLRYVAELCAVYHSNMHWNLNKVSRRHKTIYSNLLQHFFKPSSISWTLLHGTTQTAPVRRRPSRGCKEVPKDILPEVSSVSFSARLMQITNPCRNKAVILHKMQLKYSTTKSRASSNAVTHPRTTLISNHVADHELSLYVAYHTLHHSNLTL